MKESSSERSIFHPATSAPSCGTASGGMRDLGTLGGDDALAQGVNDKGEVVGYSTLAGGAVTHGFVWTAGAGMKDAGTLNDASTRLRTIDKFGTSPAPGPGKDRPLSGIRPTGFEGLGFLAGGSFSYAARVNDLVEIAGFSDTDIAVHAFRWTAGTGMVDLGALSGADGRSEALDISNGGGIVGGTTTAADPIQPARISLDRKPGDDAAPLGEWQHLTMRHMD